MSLKIKKPYFVIMNIFVKFIYLHCERLIVYKIQNVSLGFFKKYLFMINVTGVIIMCFESKIMCICLTYTFLYMNNLLIRLIT